MAINFVCGIFKGKINGIGQGEDSVYQPERQEGTITLTPNVVFHEILCYCVEGHDSIGIEYYILYFHLCQAPSATVWRLTSTASTLILGAYIH